MGFSCHVRFVKIVLDSVEIVENVRLADGCLSRDEPEKMYIVKVVLESEQIAKDERENL